MKKMLMKSFCIFSVLTTYLLINSFPAYAIGVGPGKIVETINAGESKTIELEYLNSESIALPIGINGYRHEVIDPVSNKRYFTEEPSPRSIEDWLQYSTEPIVLGPTETGNTPLTISVPAQTAPGTYSGALLVSAIPEALEGSSIVGVYGQVMLRIIITVPGDANENMELNSFNVNAASLKNGQITFDINIKNTGESIVNPVGNITIYDKQGDLIDEAYAVKETIYDQEIIKEWRSEIPFNANLIPGEAKTVQVKWEDRQVDQGKYTAKLKFYYGADETLLEKSLDFEISENFSVVEFGAENGLSGGLPVNFNVTLKNTGTTKLEPTGYFEITNIFGSQKKRVDLTAEELALVGGETKVLNNLAWDSGFALGIYTAKLNLNVSGQIFTASNTFVVLNWWQTIITLVLLFLIIFLVYKSVTGYTKMKKKLEKTKTTEKNEERME